MCRQENNGTEKTAFTVEHRSTEEQIVWWTQSIVIAEEKKGKETEKEETPKAITLVFCYVIVLKEVKLERRAVIFESSSSLRTVCWCVALTFEKSSWSGHGHAGMVQTSRQRRQVNSLPCHCWYTDGDVLSPPQNIIYRFPNMLLN